MCIYTCGYLMVVIWWYINSAESSCDETTITFSEYPLNTTITDQYSSRGIIFTGDNPFISTDGANPTSPVLSGTPQFQGMIGAHFSIPVVSFQIDAGYFNALGSTRLEYYDQEGNKLGQASNTQYGIETFIVNASGVADWKMSIFEEEPAGYAIDNVKYWCSNVSILFREKANNNDGFWFFKGDLIPGFDHTAIQFNDVVYESHPGYGSGIYINADNTKQITMTQINGVQAQHIVGTFQHDSTTLNSPVIDLEEISLDYDEFTASMQTFIQNKLAAGSGFRYPDFSSILSLTQSMSPYAQKGGIDDKYTCVGLLEAAAEHVGYNNGQGFIRDQFESFNFKGWQAPLLSPQLLLFSLKMSNIMNSVKQFIQGFFDPVEFIMVDPIGRRLGSHYNHTQDTNNTLIPYSFFSGYGFYQQILILNPIPGYYRFEFIGVGDDVFAALSEMNESNQIIINKFVKIDEILIVNDFPVFNYEGSPGDVNGDGNLSVIDVDLIRSMPLQFVSGYDPADVNGDGIISSVDADLLQQLIDGGIPDKNSFENVIFTEQPTSAPTLPTVGVRQCFIGAECKQHKHCCPKDISAAANSVNCEKKEKKKHGEHMKHLKHSKDPQHNYGKCCIESGFIGCEINDDCCGKGSICSIDGICATGKHTHTHKSGFYNEETDREIMQIFDESEADGSMLWVFTAISVFIFAALISITCYMYFYNRKKDECGDELSTLSNVIEWNNI